MHEGHRERIKKKYLLDGIDKFNDHEILELALYYAIPRKNTNEIAHALIDKFGTFSAVFDAPVNMLKQVPGMGESAALFIKLIPDLARAYIDGSMSTEGKLFTIKEACDKLALKFIGRKEETVALMLFDSKNKMLYNGIINKGTVNAVDLYARKIIELIVMYNASAGIIAHNHPSGVALPSAADLESTERLKSIFKSMGVNFIDHIIVADGDYVSLESSSKESLKKFINFADGIISPNDIIRGRQLKRV